MKSQALEKLLDTIASAQEGVLAPVEAEKEAHIQEVLSAVAESTLWNLRNQVGMMIFDGADDRFLQVRPWNAQAIAAARCYSHTKQPNCLVLWGPPGYGKTTLAIRAAKSAIERAKTCRVHFERASVLLRRLRGLFPSEQMQEIRVLNNKDLLILDDLGVSSLEKAAVEELLLEIVDWRYARGKALIVTTNVPLEQFESCFGGRVASRLKDKKWSRIFELCPPQIKG